jgi:hypothetical protein
VPIKFGEIDANQILENEFRINVLERIISEVFLRNADRLALPNPEEVENIRREVVNQLRLKYPNSGITYNPPVQVAR